MARKIIESTAVKKLEVKETVTGFLIRFEQGSYGENPVIQDSNGVETVLAGDTVLQTKLSVLRDKLPVRVWITRLEDAKSGTGRMYHDYKVEYDDGS